MKATNEMNEIQRLRIEEKHNVYVDADSMQYNVGGGYDAVYGWQPIPQEWIDRMARPY